MDARTLQVRQIFKGRVLQLNLEQVCLPNGVEATMEVIRHSGAAAVLPMLDHDRVLLIRQYRHAVGGFIWEVPAGRLDQGEDPAACAARELEEEVGYRAGRLEKLGEILTTPGFCDERIHLFLATDLKPVPTNREHDEVMEVEALRLSDALGMVRSGAIADAKTIVSLHAALLADGPSDARRGAP
ncbi:MAG: NUDIX hydrolase [Deltaproteobacteria bacterium]|nr:NUDIX hydrolase [Deltaproteobacteria bacterium]